MLLDYFKYLTAFVMTVIAVWRFPAVRYGDAHRRALWGGYAGFAVALWLYTPAVMRAVDRIPIVDLSTLMRHFASTAAILAALTYVATSYGKSAEPVVPRHVSVSRWIARASYWTGAIGVTLLTTLFFTVVNRPEQSADFLSDHAGQWGAATYMTVFYFFPLVTTAVCGYQWSRASRQAEAKSMRIGLKLMGISMWMGLLHTVARITILWSAVLFSVSSSLMDELFNATALWMDLLFLIVAVGASIPTTSAITVNLKTWKILYRLHPLWFDLVQAFPGTSLYPPESRLAELIHMRVPSDVRLDRWTQDIADACEKLRYYAPEELLLTAEDATTAEPDPEPAAEAFWIAAALRAASENEANRYATDPLNAKPFVDTASEAAWLERVGAVYSRIPATGAQKILDEARRVER
ncbi:MULTISPECIES: MAB_1171c family putative transporter [unclassified Streptomyces]|uniref:MAB_1171c family putative transporter n=1 Tax=unclassified Streptomyces TaxID=2593676 RepID=UPI002E18BBFE|nr:MULTISPECIES: MAB_1171c family putative transporter [unclassified Streptomyces]